MKILHYANSFDHITLTFIRSYVKKSREFAEIRCIANEGSSSDIHLLPSIYYNRAKPKELFHYLSDKFSPTTYREREWRSVISSFAPEVVHCHFGPQGIIFSDFVNSSNLSTPFITSFYGYDAFRLPKNNSKYRDDLRKLFTMENAFFFVEGFCLKKQLESLGADDKKILINPILVEIQDLKPRPFPENQVKFLMVGRFVEKKGFELCLEALGQLKSKLPPFKVDIIGYGELEENLRMKVIKHSLEKQVSFLGKQSNEMVKNALYDYDFFLHPSHTAANGDSEGGAPTIIIEAQAAGLPVIASNHADIPYVMGYHDFLAQESDLESLKNCIVHAVNHQNLAHLIALGKKHVAKQHDFGQSNQYESNVRQIIDIFETNS